MSQPAAIPDQVHLGTEKDAKRARIKHPIRRTVFSFIYIAAMGYAVVLGFVQPYKNWDMLGYVGSVTQWRISDPEKIYAQTMKAVEENSSAPLFRSYQQNPLSARADAFYQELPIYQVKPLYNALVWTVSHIVSLPAATWIVSASSFAFLAALLFAWHPHHMARETWLIMLVMLSFLWQWPMSHLARLSTPDSLVMLLQMAAIYAWMQYRSFIVFALFCWLACFARPDGLFLSIALTICFAIPCRDRAISSSRACVLILFLVITCIAITHFSRWYSYGQFFIHNYVDRRPFPGQITDHLTLERYWTILSPSFLLFIGAPRQIAMIVFSLIAGLCYYLKSADNKPALLLLLAAWTALAVRFLLFPAWGDDRYYFAYWVPILFACGELISPYASVLSKIIQAHRFQIRDL